MYNIVIYNEDRCLCVFLFMCLCVSVCVYVLCMCLCCTAVGIATRFVRKVVCLKLSAPQGSFWTSLLNFLIKFFMLIFIYFYFFYIYFCKRDLSFSSKNKFCPHFNILYQEFILRFLNYSRNLYAFFSVSQQFLDIRKRKLA